MTFRKSILALTLVLPVLSAFATDRSSIEKSVPLKDGSTVHQFKDGKMAMEDKFGRAFRMKDGETMQTADGKSISMQGDEVARLSFALESHLRGGK